MLVSCSPVLVLLPAPENRDRRSTISRAPERTVVALVVGLAAEQWCSSGRSSRTRGAHYRLQSYLRPASLSAAGRGSTENQGGDGDLVNMLLVQHLPLVLLGSAVVVKAADLVIRIPGDLSQQDGFYRLDYRCIGGALAQGVKGVLRVAPSSWVIRHSPICFLMSARSSCII